MLLFESALLKLYVHHSAIDFSYGNLPRLNRIALPQEKIDTSPISSPHDTLACFNIDRNFPFSSFNMDDPAALL